MSYYMLLQDDYPMMAFRITYINEGVYFNGAGYDISNVSDNGKVISFEIDYDEDRRADISVKYDGTAHWYQSYQFLCGMVDLKRGFNCQVAALRLASLLMENAYFEEDDDGFGWDGEPDLTFTEHEFKSPLGNQMKLVLIDKSQIENLDDALAYELLKGVQPYGVKEGAGK